MPLVRQRGCGKRLVTQQTLIDGRYQVLSELGTGGSGSVFGAVDRKTNRRVAVKLFSQQVQWDHSARANIEREAQITGPRSVPLSNR